MSTHIHTVSVGKRASAKMAEHVERANVAIERYNATDTRWVDQHGLVGGYRDELAYYANVANNTRRAGQLADCICSRIEMDIDHATNGVPIVLVGDGDGATLRFNRTEAGYYHGYIANGDTDGGLIAKGQPVAGLYRTLAELKTAAVARIKVAA